MATAVEPFRESLTADELRRTFEELAGAWRKRTRYWSFIQKMVATPEYQRIIGLGPQVIPVILSDLQREPAPWFRALSALTGENPVDPAGPGRIKAMMDAWLKWGTDNGWIA